MLPCAWGFVDLYFCSTSIACTEDMECERKHHSMLCSSLSFPGFAVPSCVLWASVGCWEICQYTKQQPSVRFPVVHGKEEASYSWFARCVAVLSAGAVFYPAPASTVFTSSCFITAVRKADWSPVFDCLLGHFHRLFLRDSGKLPYDHLGRTNRDFELQNLFFFLFFFPLTTEKTCRKMQFLSPFLD